VSVFTPINRQSTPEEVRLRREISSLARESARKLENVTDKSNREIAALDAKLLAANAELSRLREELETHKSLVKLRDLEIEGLGAVIVRDRKRIEAETAIAARQIADATGRAGYGGS
jgi:hypothetical protein